jgi:hypothetical protein
MPPSRFVSAMDQGGSVVVCFVGAVGPDTVCGSLAFYAETQTRVQQVSAARPAAVCGFPQGVCSSGGPGGACLPSAGLLPLREGAHFARSGRSVKGYRLFRLTMLFVARFVQSE